MKKLTVLLMTICFLSFKADAPQEKLLKVEMTIVEWGIYFRCSDRLKSFAGIEVQSGILLRTIDTINYFNQVFIHQLNSQIDTTRKMK